MPNVLFIGDIVGRPGRRFVIDRLKGLRGEFEADIVVANAENAAGGSGLTSKIAAELFEAGVDALTLGDHVWDQRGFEREIGDFERICRPANLPDSCPGRRWVVVDCNGFRLGVFTVLGRQYLRMMSASPFAVADAIIEEMRDAADGILAEIHAEATSEKIAFGWYMDGRVSAVVGTHTHVPTADWEVLPRGTGYITDAGMTGPFRSVLGREIAPVVARFLDGMPRRFPVAEDDVRLCGVSLRLSAESGICERIEPLMVRASESSGDQEC